MAIRLYSEFKSDNGTQYKIEIHDANWLAAATEFVVDSNGFELTYEGETDDIVSPIVGSKLSFGAYSENATFETFINTLKTFQENRFQLAVRKYNGASYDLYWAGWILQDLVTIEDQSQPYIYQIAAADGLGRLANVDYNLPNGLTNGLTKVTNIIGNALSLIETDNLWGAGDVYLQTSVDWWETTSQTYSATKDTLEEHAIDIRVFEYEDDNANTIYAKAYDVLKELCITYGTRLYQSNGRWVFEQYVNRSNTSRIVSSYNKSITRLSTSSVSDDVTINQTSAAARLAGGQFNYLPAVGSVSVEYARDKFNAQSKPYTFRSAYPTKTLGIIGASTSTQLKFFGTHNYNITSNTGATTNDGIIAIVFRMQIRIESATTPGLFYYYNRPFNGFAANSIYGNAVWSTTAGYYYYHAPFAKVIFGAVTTNLAPTILTANLPTSGTLRITAEHYGNFDPADGTAYNLEPHQTDTWTITLIVARMDNANDDSVSVIYSAQNTNANVDSKIELSLGTTRIANGLFQTGDLSVFDGTNWVSGIAFRRGASGTGNQILNLLTLEMVGLHSAPIKRFNGEIQNISSLSQRLIFDGGYFINSGGSFNAQFDRWSADWFMISYQSGVATPIDDIKLPLEVIGINKGDNDVNVDGVLEVGRVGGMIVDVNEQKIGPFEQLGTPGTPTGARVNGTMNVTGDVTLDAGLDVDGAAQFNNDVNITGSVTSTGPLTGEYVQLDTTYNTTPVQGQIVWSQDDGTIDVGLNSNVTMQVGQEQFWFVKNQTGSTIPKGTAVRAAGTLGASGRILAAPMVADGSVPARFFLGIAAEDILNGGDGYVTTFGKIRQLNTSAFTEGSVLWCNPAVAGGLTATEPAAPNLKLAVAFVVRSDASSGVLAVRSEIGARVSDASDVQITSVADNDLLQYNTATSRWENVAGTTTNIGEGTNLYYTDARSRAAISETIDGISYNNTTGVFSLDAGRVIVTTTQTGEWDTAYNDRIVSAAVTGTTSKTLTLTQGDGGTITATWSDYDTAPVTSVNGLTGDVVLTTSNIGEGTNLYYTDARARAALSAGVGISYNNATGVITNSAPDQVVAITASTAIAVTGTYPNFTIENTAPDQVVAVTAGTGISVTGTYPNFTITNTSPSSGGTITGGGTTNYLSKWTGASALGDSLVFDNGTNVGIGTATPTAKLDVSGNVRASAAFISQGGNNSWTGAAIFMDWQNTYGRFGAYNYATNAWMPISLNDGSIYITGANGNVGIGTTAPAYKLDVSGGFRVDGTNGDFIVDATGNDIYFTRNGTNYFYGTQASSSFAFYTNSNLGLFQSSAGRVGIGTTSPAQKLDISQGSIFLSGSGSKYLYIRRYDGLGTHSFGVGSDEKLILSLSGSNPFIIDGGNVGIGTTSPSQKLHVVGNGLYTGNLDVGHSVSTGDAAINLGTGRTGNGFAYIDLIGDTTYTDYGLRILRNNGGANTTSLIVHRGTGDFSIQNNEAANLVFLTAATERMRISSTGNVGIGTTSPSEKLQVAGNAVVTTSSFGLTTNALKLENSSGDTRSVGQFLGDPSVFNAAYETNTTNGSVAGIKFNWYSDNWMISATRSGGTAIYGFVISKNGSEKLVISENGNVGIGTTTPGAKLEIAGTNSTLALSFGNSVPNNPLFINTYGGWSGIGMDQTTAGLRLAGDSGGNNLVDVGYYSGNVVAHANWVSRMRVLGNGNVGIGTTAPLHNLSVAGKIGGATFSDSYVEFPSSGHTILKANNDVIVGYSQSFYVKQGGNVGIGTTDPQGKLDVTDGVVSVAIKSTLAVESSSNNQTLAQISFYKHYGLAIGSAIRMLQSGGTSNYPQAHLAFFTNDGSAGWSTPTERMRIKDGGNVGIGTADPTEKLHVDGNAVLTYNNSYQGINSIGNKAILARVSPTTGIINYAEYATATNLNGFVMGSTATQLKGIFATNKLEFTTNSSTRMTITSGGLVGIGTTAPSHILHITDVMRMDNVSAYSPGLTGDSLAKHGYGDVSNDRYLAEPAIWFKINVDGTEYVIPGYTEVI